MRPKGNPARVWGPSRGEVVNEENKLPENLPARLPYRKGRRLSSVDGDAATTPAVG